MFTVTQISLEEQKEIIKIKILLNHSFTIDFSLNVNFILKNN